MIPRADGDARTYQLIMDLRRAGVSDRRVLGAIERVRREDYLDPLLAPMAYADRPIALACGERASPPSAIARALEALEPGPGNRVLEIGLGSGYQAAVLTALGGLVFSVERHPKLLTAASDRLRARGQVSVVTRGGDGRDGWPEAAPFDRIILAGGVPERPDALIAALTPGGVCVAPVGLGPDQRLMRYQMGADGVEARDCGACEFDMLGPVIEAS